MRKGLRENVRNKTEEKVTLNDIMPPIADHSLLEAAYPKP